MSVEMARNSIAMSGRVMESIGEIVIASLETVAQVSFGQGLLRIIDRFLWIVEKSAQWSLPVHEVDNEENHGSKTFGRIELVRPLPWIFFLPSLVILRACRLGINVGAFLLGFPKLQTTDVVRFVQKSRRRLRTVKLNGLKYIRSRKGNGNKEEELREAKKSLIKSMLSTLSALSCMETSRRTPSPPPTRVYIQRLEPEPALTPEEKSTTESNGPPNDPKRKYAEVVGLDDSESELQFEEEATIEKLERLAAEESENDHDFDPAEEEYVTSEGDDEEEDEEDDDDYISESEIDELHRSQLLSKMAKVIIEEPEPEPEPEPKPKPEVEPEESAAKPSSSKIGDDKEDISNFYSPISSPGNSIGDFTSPVDDDVNQSILAEDPRLLKQSGSKILSNIDSPAEKSSAKIPVSGGINPEEVMKSSEASGSVINEEKGNVKDDKGNNSGGQKKVNQK